MRLRCYTYTYTHFRTLQLFVRSKKMNLMENEGIENNTFVVTGGLGFVGSNLCLELVRRGARQVRAFDIRSHSPCSDQLRQSGVLCIQGDVTCKQDVDKALQGADCVFHLASYGMTGKEMLQSGHVDHVNINGTIHVIDACIEYGIGRLVYLSTYNAVFGGKEIVNGNEGQPYFPMDDHVDPFGRSKFIAEKLVLNSNGSPLRKEKGRCLYTSAIRPAATYGPGEERHLLRIINYAKLGLLLFRVGESAVKTDWVYVDNLVSALLLSSMGLLDNKTGKEGKPVAAGQPYFVSDGSPVNTCEFIRPLLNSLDYDLPKVSLAVPQALILGNFFRLLYSIMYPCLGWSWIPEPLILPADVYKVGVTHHFSILKAKEELGYVPKVSPREGMAATISYWKERKRSINGPSIYAWLWNVIVVSWVFAALYMPEVGPVPLLRDVALFFFRTMWFMKLAFILTVAAHVLEGIYAWNLAKTVDPANSTCWLWQTVVLGYFSLRFLLKRAKV